MASPDEAAIEHLDFAIAEFQDMKMQPVLERAPERRGLLKINEKLRLVPGHYAPTCNVHNWYVGVRNGKLESLWPITARGKTY